MDIVFLLDATGSMGSTIQALKPAFEQVFRLAPLFVSARFHLITYRDFDQTGDSLYMKFGPYDANDIDKMITTIASVRPDGGGDDPECQKYAFNRLLREFNDQDRIIVFHFTDAPPHSYPFVNDKKDHSNHTKEGNRLRIDRMEPEWINLCNMYKARGIPVYTIGRVFGIGQRYYAEMGRITGGDFVYVETTDSDGMLQNIMNVYARALGYDEYTLIKAKVIRMEPVNGDEIEFAKSPMVFITEQIELRSCSDVANRTTVETRYKTDSEYQKLCFDVFCKLIEIKHIKALTYNPLLGCLYRNMCRKSKLIDTEARRTQLNKLMSDTMSKLKGTVDFTTISKWIEESYNRVDEINELISSYQGDMVPYMTIQTTNRITKKDLTLACKIPMPQNLALLGKMISSIVLETTMPKYMPEVFIPFGMPDEDVFALLSHLMCPGVRLDFKPSVVVAVVALNGRNAILKDRALRWLQSICGKWMDFDDSALYLFGFMKILLSIDFDFGDILTTKERLILIDYCHISTVKYNNFELSVDRKFMLTIDVGKLYSDHKVKCTECKQYRSVSIMTDRGCGICLSYDRDMISALGDLDKAHSHLYDCTTCGSRYAVRNTEGLRTKPKCYYCRFTDQKAPVITCSICDVGMVLPEVKFKPTSDQNYICALCCENDNKMRIETLSVRFHDLLIENPGLIGYLTYLNIDIDLITNRDSLYSLRGKFKRLIDIPLISNLIWQKRPVLNSTELIKQLQDMMQTGQVNASSCSICFENFIHHDLESMCYNNGCSTKACKPCIKQWYSSNIPGHEVYENRTKCPSCKRVPRGGQAFTNPWLKELITKLPPFDSDWHYAWCYGCGSVLEYMERRCGGPDPIRITNYLCETCQKPAGVRNCPGCNVQCVKVSGCDHITCPKCHIDWCYRCEWIAPIDKSENIYDHLYNDHDNIWGRPALEQNPEVAERWNI